MADIDYLTGQLRQLRDHYSGIQGGEQQLYQRVADYARQQGLSPETVTQVVRNVAPNPDAWDVNRVRSIMGSQPSYGLGPASYTLNQGASDATQRIAGTQQQVADIFGKGLQLLDPYMQEGGQANNLQAALSGALGPEAQKKAFAEYTMSPGVEFAQKEAERTLLRNASATGGLGGGNVLRDLTQLAAGTAMQDFGNQFQRIGEVANRGYGAATAGAGLRGQEAGIQSGLGQFAANIPLATSQAQAGMQFQTGRDVSSNINATTSALSALVNRQGEGMTDIIGNTTDKLNEAYQRAMAGDEQAIREVMAMVGNLATGNASMVSGLPIIPGQQTDWLGKVGQVAGGVGGLALGINSMKPATQPVYGPLPPTYGLDSSSTAFAGYA